MLKLPHYETPPRRNGWSSPDAKEAIAEKPYRKRPIDMLRQWHSRVEAWMLTEAGVIEAQGAATTGN